jgi:hypothetical protein
MNERQFGARLTTEVASFRLWEPDNYFSVEMPIWDGEAGAMMRPWPRFSRMESR